MRKRCLRELGHGIAIPWRTVRKSWDSNHERPRAARKGRRPYVQASAYLRGNRCALSSLAPRSADRPERSRRDRSAHHLERRSPGSQPGWDERCPVAIWHDALLRQRSQKHRERSKGLMPGQICSQAVDSRRKVYTQRYTPNHTRVFHSFALTSHTANAPAFPSNHQPVFHRPSTDLSTGCTRHCEEPTGPAFGGP